MFQSLYRLGVKPENISLIGKCYSSCKEVYEEMLKDGIDVCAGSLFYSSHHPFDDFFDQKIQSFLSERLSDLSSDSYDHIIVLDDGGKCIKYLSENLPNNVSIVAIEQTSSGYEAIRSCHLTFPVINVARSPVKLSLESPMIAQAAAERLYKSLKERDLAFEQALIIGGGAIGQAIKEKLSPDMSVFIYDKDESISDCAGELPNILQDFRLIIGCTGTTSIPQHLHSSLSAGTALVSVSSSDREFDSLLFEKTHL